MPRNHVDSITVQHHDDGSYTETSEITYYPPTAQRKAAAWLALGGLVVAPFTPLILAAGVGKWRDLKERSAAKKAESDKK